jgi:hypothetical protein
MTKVSRYNYRFGLAIALYCLCCTTVRAGDRTGQDLLDVCNHEGADQAVFLGDCVGYVKGIYDATRVLANLSGGKCLKEDTNALEKVGFVTDLLKKQPCLSG